MLGNKIGEILGLWNMKAKVSLVTYLHMENLTYGQLSRAISAIFARTSVALGHLRVLG